jgi:hypothetical protein
VRPDGQVAWRIAWSASDATSQLASAVTMVLSAAANHSAGVPTKFEFQTNLSKSDTYNDPTDAPRSRR